MELHKTLSKIQKELNVPKGRHNKFSGFYYRSQEDILKAVKALLPEGTTLRLHDTIEQVGDRFYVKATAVLSDGKDMIQNIAYARETDIKKGMDSAQITGATSSYARKYSLNGMFGIDDTADPDTQDNTQEEITNNQSIEI